MTYSTGQLFFTWITSNASCDEHAVTDEENAARMRSNSSDFVALCGAEFVAADMRVPPGVRCGRCSVIVQQWAESHGMAG